MITKNDQKNKMGPKLLRVYLANDKSLKVPFLGDRVQKVRGIGAKHPNPV